MDGEDRRAIAHDRDAIASSRPIGSRGCRLPGGIARRSCAPVALPAEETSCDEPRSQADPESKQVVHDVGALARPVEPWHEKLCRLNGERQGDRRERGKVRERGRGMNAMDTPSGKNSRTLRLVSLTVRNAPSGGSATLEKSQARVPMAPASRASRDGVSVTERITPRLMSNAQATRWLAPTARPTRPAAAKLTASRRHAGQEPGERRGLAEMHARCLHRRVRPCDLRRDVPTRRGSIRRR